MHAWQDLAPRRPDKARRGRPVQGVGEDRGTVGKEAGGGGLVGRLGGEGGIQDLALNPQPWPLGPPRPSRVEPAMSLAQVQVAFLGLLGHSSGFGNHPLYSELHRQQQELFSGCFWNLTSLYLVF